MGDSFATRANKPVQACLQRLTAVWGELGLNAEEQRGRFDEVLLHLSTLMTNIAEQEERARDEIFASIENSRQVVRELADELGVDCKKVRSK